MLQVLTLRALSFSCGLRLVLFSSRVSECVSLTAAFPVPRCFPASRLIVLVSICGFVPVSFSRVVCLSDSLHWVVAHHRSLSRVRLPLLFGMYCPLIESRASFPDSLSSFTCFFGVFFPVPPSLVVLLSRVEFMLSLVELFFHSFLFIFVVSWCTL